jgi:hypothetical protein
MLQSLQWALNLMWVCSLRSTRNEPMLIQMLPLLTISEIMHMKEVAALLGPFLLWPQVGIIKTHILNNI